MAQDRFGADVAQLLEMFPEVDPDVVGEILVKCQGSVEDAVNRLLQRSAGPAATTTKKRKRATDIRTLFGAPAPDIRMKDDNATSLSAKPAALVPWDPTKEAMRPITLTPETLAASGLPLALYPNFLPPNEANDLLKEMLDDAGRWETIKWVIFEREVMSPHVSRLFKLDGVVQHSTLYTQEDNIHTFTASLLTVKGKVDAAVEAALQRRPRHPLEATTPWAANVALANCYRTHQQSVGAHSDALTDLGPRPTIASLTLGAERIFRIKRLATDAAPAQTYNLALPHNALLIMFPPFQEFYRHEVPPVRAQQVKWHPMAKDARINLTLRMLRPEYTTNSPHCLCGKPAVLRTVNKATKATVGEYFYICAGSVPKACTYFLWLKDRDGMSA
ncbi:hypothetical protein ACHHYP_01748 [Achlya hypogyna]|uniref:Fe2OG dioxygenase domain-containing protein n=1 Tax=Achlya hypogyna TaxID=1202772 RepID=A0A1V9ZT88_ACHHY|nr:hypothetical protein ACHHYP_01748 [Achlya hypogyna]